RAAEDTEVTKDTDEDRTRFLCGLCSLCGLVDASAPVLHGAARVRGAAGADRGARGRAVGARQPDRRLGVLQGAGGGDRGRARARAADRSRACGVVRALGRARLASDVSTSARFAPSGPCANLIAA